MIVFKTLKIEGFGCYESLTRFTLNEPGINIITGPNGAGKTTIFNALYWVLFGISMKPNSEIQTWEHKRSDNWVGTKVSITILKGNVKISIIRCKDYQLEVNGAKGKDRLILYEGEVESNIKDKRKLQAYIERLLGFGPEVFISAIMFPQKGKRFIEEPGPKKKEILEMAFNLTWISEVAEVLKAHRKSLESNRGTLSSIISTHEEAKRNLEELLEENDKNKILFEENKSRAIGELLAKIEKLDIWDKEAIVNLRHELSVHEIDLKVIKEKADSYNLPELRNQAKNYQSNLGKLNGELNTLKAFRQRLESAENMASESNICPTCGAVMSDDKHKEHQTNIQGDLKKTRQLMTDVRESIKSTEAKLLVIDATLSLAEEQVTVHTQTLLRMGEIKRLLQDHNTNEEKRIDLLEQIDSLKKSEFIDTSESILVKLEKVNENLSIKINELNALKKELSLYDWALKDPFSNNGLKTFLFRILLDKLNLRLEHYATHTGFKIRLEIINTGSRENVEAIITRDDYPVSYYDLSAGEQQITNLALGFAQSDILVEENPTNLWGGDEILESLDEENVEKVGNFLQAFLGKERALFIITHQSRFRPSGAKLIEFKKPKYE